MMLMVDFLLTLVIVLAVMIVFVENFGHYVFDIEVVVLVVD